MPEDLEKPLVDPKNFNREGIDVVSSACNKCNTVTPFVISNCYSINRQSNALFS